MFVLFCNCSSISIDAVMDRKGVIRKVSLVDYSQDSNFQIVDTTDILGGVYSIKYKEKELLFIYHFILYNRDSFNCNIDIMYKYAGHDNEIRMYIVPHYYELDTFNVHSHTLSVSVTNHKLYLIDTDKDIAYCFDSEYIVSGMKVLLNVYKLVEQICFNSISIPVVLHTDNGDSFLQLTIVFFIGATGILNVMKLQNTEDNETGGFVKLSISKAIFGGE